MAEVRKFVYNHDVCGLQRRINRFITETMNAASNGVSQVSGADQTRISSYLSAIRAYVEWIVAQPELDLPETSPTQWPLDVDPVVPEVENESLIDLVNMFVLAREEIINGQSGRLAAGLIKFDHDRLLAIVTKAESFISDYIAKVTPLDLPESSPMRAEQGQGKTGV